MIMTDAEYDARMEIENDATAGERNSEAERLASAVKPISFRPSKAAVLRSLPI